MEEKKEQKVTKELALKRVQEIHNMLPIVEVAQLKQLQLELKYFEGWLSRDKDAESEEKPDLKIAKKNAS
jgi:hypothetical protein